MIFPWWKSHCLLTALSKSFAGKTSRKNNIVGKEASLALLSIRSLAISTFLFTAAISSGVSPALLGLLTSMPRRIAHRIVFMSPFFTRMCSNVFPSSSTCCISFLSKSSSFKGMLRWADVFMRKVRSPIFSSSCCALSSPMANTLLQCRMSLTLLRAWVALLSWGPGSMLDTFCIRSSEGASVVSPENTSFSRSRIVASTEERSSAFASCCKPRAPIECMMLPILSSISYSYVYITLL